MSNGMTLDEALSEVETRFLLQLPDSELTRPDRLLFWIQEASWFYDDFFADNNPDLPRYTFKLFTKAIFNHCPLFAGMDNNVDEIFREFGMYRSKIPVHGCIVLNPEMTKALLVCSWNGNSWTFPRGKVNENETPISCAIREMQEETGFDVTPYIHEKDTIRFDDDGGVIELFIVTNVPESTQFSPLVRKEISKIEFFPLNGFPKNVFAVKQFLPELKKWIKRRKENQPRGTHFTSPPPKSKHENTITSPLNTRSQSASSALGNRTTSTSRAGRVVKKILLNESALFNARNVDTFAGDGSKRWSVNAMFSANAQLTGKKFEEYDGNPHNFGSSHPRYVDYNNISNEIGKNHPDLIGKQNDFSLLATQSEEFHKFRGQENLSVSVPDNTPSRKKSSKAEKKAAAVGLDNAQKQAPETATTSNRNDPNMNLNIHVSKLLPSKFRLNVDKIMAKFDKAIEGSKRKP